MKGHVPEVNLARYGSRVHVARLLDQAANAVSGMGEYNDANTLFGLAEKYRGQAYELRVDIPEPDLRKP